jgi:hypothetical protein
MVYLWYIFTKNNEQLFQWTNNFDSDIRTSIINKWKYQQTVYTPLNVCKNVKKILQTHICLDDILIFKSYQIILIKICM